MAAFCDSAGSHLTEVEVERDSSLSGGTPTLVGNTIVLDVGDGDPDEPNPVVYVKATLENGDIEQITITQPVVALSPPRPATTLGNWSPNTADGTWTVDTTEITADAG